MQSHEQHDEVITAVATMMSDYIEVAIDDEWTEAILVAVIEDDESGLTYGRYKTAESPDAWRCFDTDYTIYFAFDAIRMRMRELLGEAWEREQFTLQPNGVYSLSFGYRDVGPEDERAVSSK